MPDNLAHKIRTILFCCFVAWIVIGAGVLAALWS